MPLAGRLTVREKPTGGNVAGSVKLTGEPIDGKREFLLFFHGYNNSEAEAENRFTTFAQNLEKLSPGTAFNIYGFYWPGDKGIKIISTIAYPAELAPAKDSAKRLFEFLKPLSGPGGTPVSVKMLGHSLGCRSILEILKRFAGTQSKLVFQAISLMAAAVPVGKAEASGEFGSAIARVSKTHVLFSTRDRVLQLAFPLGETLAFDGFFPEAVGRHGHPSVWTRPEQTSLAHADCWFSSESVSRVGSFLGAPIHAVPAANAVAEHITRSADDIPANSIAARNLAPVFR